MSTNPEASEGDLSMSADQITLLSLTHQRNAASTNGKRELKKALDLLAQQPSDVPSMQVSVARLRDYRERYANLSGPIRGYYKDKTKLMQDLETGLDFEESMLDAIARLDAAIHPVSSPQVVTVPAPPIASAAAGALPSRDWKAKLPVLEVEKFSGDPMKWAAFKDTFMTVVDAKQMPVAEKFRYLKSYLAGDALRMLDGYNADGASYGAAWKALEERYGDPNLAIFAHLSAMIDMKPLQGYSVEQLMRLRDECECHVRSLVALGLDESTFEKVFTPLILSKLPMAVRFELNREMVDVPWSLSKLRELLRKEIRARDMSKRQGDMGTQQKHHDSTYKQNKDRKLYPEKGGSDSLLPAMPVAEKGKQASRKPPKSRPSLPCKFCEGHHYTDMCDAYADVSARLRKLGTGCRRCLGSNHQITDCKSIKVCKYCDSKSHNRSLCEAKFGTSSRGTKVNINAALDENCSESDTDQGDPFSVDVLAAASCKHVHMQTAVTHVRNIDGTRQAKARLLFDTAASRSFVTTQKAEQIGAKACGTESMSIAGFEQRSRRSRSYQVVQLDVLCKDGAKLRIEARVAETLTCPISKPALDLSKYPAVASLALAEPCVDGDEPLRVDILIGADHYYDFVTGETIRESDGTVFVSSRLGYLTSGGSDQNSPQDSLVHVVLASPETGSGDSFDLEKFWRLEALGIKDEELKNTSGDEEALYAFQKSVCFENGRYSVTLPWKEVHPELQSHYNLSKGRLRSVVRRLSRDKELLSKYDQTIREQFDKHIIEAAPTQPDGKVHYIPHHEVLTPQKTTTKLRIVYDCSAKLAGDDVSLNDCLFRGPVILEDMCGMLLRFRLHTIAIISDIEKAFLQISVQVQDRDVLRFLWLKDVNREVSKDNIVEYRFARVLFGANSSPSLLGMTVDHHLRSVGTPNAIKAAEDMFVDNNVTGVETLDEGIQYYRELKEIFQKASMNLREWFTNEARLKGQFATSDQGISNLTKVLGIEWDTVKDELRCSGKFGRDVGTKRQAVSTIATIFDPCGWFGPVVLPGKLLIREIWQRKCGWDEPLPPELLEKWQKLEGSLSSIGQQKLPRRVSKKVSVAHANRQLHCFVDASALAYAAAVYLRCEKNGVVETSLLLSKSRVSPAKTEVTIPKLELMAVVLGVGIIEFVRKELRYPPVDSYLWSDSQCVLHWISSNKKSTVFVANRVKKIKEIPNISIRYVPTDLNPADVASRGTECAKLVDFPMWWQGPEFLANNESSWPQWEPSSKSDSLVKTEETFSVEQALPVASGGGDWIEISRFSRLSKLLRVVGWILRFIHNLRNKNKRSKGPLKACEIVAARHEMDKLAQAELLSLNPIEIIRRKQLAVFADDRGILRCKSRLGEAELAADAMYPTLLPDDSHYTKLVVIDAHERANHAGVSQTLAKLRESYWVTRGRTRVKGIINDCRLCRRIKGGVYRVPPMPDIPWFRVSQSLPFSCVGLDYLGPLPIKLANEERKVWICLFTCAVTRAVHLEVVDDMTTSQFLLAFRRFNAQYGLPKIVVSDNAKQFTTGVQVMAKIWRDVTTSTQIQDYSSIRGVRWKFITEKAPWFGGFYERLVGTVKNGLKRVLNRRKVTLVELQTVVAEVCSVVNERPLVYLEDVPGQLVLTPAHFIRKGSSRSKSDTWEGDDDDDFVPQPTKADELIKEYRRIRKFVDSFWQVWHREYLISLREQRQKTGQRNSVGVLPAVGDVVLLVEEGLPRGTWKIGRIVALIQSQDGQVRSVSIRTPNGNELRRPIKLLVPLEYGQQGSTHSFGVGSQNLQEVENTRGKEYQASGRVVRLASRRARSKIREITAAEDA